MLKSVDNREILIYIPVPEKLKLLLPPGEAYWGQWFDPVNNRYLEAPLKVTGRRLEAESPLKKDAVLILIREGAID